MTLVFQIHSSKCNIKLTVLTDNLLDNSNLTKTIMIKFKYILIKINKYNTCNQLYMMQLQKKLLKFLTLNVQMRAQET